MENVWVLPATSQITGKCNKTHYNGENLGDWHSYFSHSMSAFFPFDSHPMLYFSI